MSARLQIEGLSKSYSGPRSAVSALQDVSLYVRAGEFVAVQGPSGCGKTTLLLAAGALLQPSGGRIFVNGQDPYALAAGQRAQFRAANIGFVFQQFHLVPYLNVLDNILASTLALSKKARGEIFSRARSPLPFRRGESEGEGKAVHEFSAETTNPLAPTLSPFAGEREERSATAASSGAVGHADRHPAGFSLPFRRGEGQGEASSGAAERGDCQSQPQAAPSLRPSPPRRGRGSSIVRSRALELIEQFGLTHRLHHVPAALSTGERQRVALARALLNNPKLLLADEPTGNLDEENGQMVLRCLAEFARAGAAVLLVTHEPRAGDHASRLVKMDGGKLR